MKATTLLLAFFSLFSLVFACSCPDYSVSFKSATQVNGNYNWSYTVCRTTAGNPVQYFMIDTPICNGMNFASCIYSYGSNLTQPSYMRLNYTYDPTTHITGLKFYNFSSFSGCKTFWFVVGPDYYQQIDKNASIKVQDYGLVCNYTVKTPLYPRVPAPEFPSVAIPLFVSIGAVFLAYNLRKRV